MNSGSGQSYMDKLKARNIPPALQEAMEETVPEQEIPMVQISAEEWMRLTETLHRMEALSAAFHRPMPGNPAAHLLYYDRTTLRRTAPHPRKAAEFPQEYRFRRRTPNVYEDRIGFS